MDKSQAVVKFVDDNHFINGTLDGNIAYYEWKRTKPLWSKKIKSTANIYAIPGTKNVLVKSIMLRTKDNIPRNENIFYMFTKIGAKMWEYRLESSTTYSASVSLDGQKVALVPSNPKGNRALLFTKLKKDVQPQKLPSGIVAVSFLSDPNYLVAAFSGKVTLLDISR